MRNDAVALVGITGGIGSGKSAVCRCFEQLGRTVLSADRIARDLTESDPDVRAAIQGKFGAAIYSPDGSLRRKDLAAVVFGNAAKRRALDAIVHPRVFIAIEAAVASLSPASRHPYVCIEAALIFESGLDARLASTIVVRASEPARLARVMQRDGVGREEVLLRMQAQMSPVETAKRADFVIDNDGPEEGLSAKVAFIDRILVHLLAPHDAG